MVVGIEGLEALSSSDRISLLGSTPSHPSAHFGTKPLIEALKRLGDAFQSRFAKPLPVGNMSLEHGGLFDINADWMSPYTAHRDGHAADILLAGLTAEERTWLKDTARELGFEEGTCEAHDGEPWHIKYASDSAPPPDGGSAVKPRIIAHQMGSIAQPGPEIPRVGDTYVARLAVDDESAGQPPPALPTLAPESHVGAPSHAEEASGMAGDCFMMLELKLSAEAIRTGVSTLTLPPYLVAYNKELQLLKREDLRIDFQNPEGGLKALATGGTSVFIKALDDFVGGAVTLTINELKAELQLAHVDLIRDDRIAFILPHRNEGQPEMPRLIARLPGGDSGKKVQWRLQMQYNRGNGERPDRNLPEDRVDIPGQADGPLADGVEPPFTAPIPGNEEWSIFDSDEWKREVAQGFFGGDGELYCRIDGRPPTLIARFHIRGINPDNVRARTVIDNLARPDATRFSYAIAKEETGEWRVNGSLYNQFLANPSDPHAGLPTWNRDSHGPGGYGIFQITGSPKNNNENIPRGQIWNWQDNIRAYVAILSDESKAELAQRFYDRVKERSDRHALAFEEDPPHEITAGIHFFTSDLAIWITAYNGWGGKIDDRYLFDPDKEAGLTRFPAAQTKRWYWNPPNKNEHANAYQSYLDKVEQEMEDLSALDNAQAVIDACMENWEAHQSDCSGFVKAVAAELRVPMPNVNADQLIDFLATSTEWQEFTAGDGVAAEEAATEGMLVIGGLKSRDLGDAHGHVVVVLWGELARGKYPRASWGSLGKHQRRDSSVNYAFDEDARDNVRYFRRKFNP
ncbi:MAG: hypothetical protein P4L84_24325 [Isosphaeraceae bacterium]|nr:hypothetical protein [Isosphaeraceae bacterium]